METFLDKILAKTGHLDTVSTIDKITNSLTLGRWVFHFGFFLAAIFRCLVDMDVAYCGQGQGVQIRGVVRHDLIWLNVKRNNFGLTSFICNLFGLCGS